LKAAKSSFSHSPGTKGETQLAGEERGAKAGDIAVRTENAIGCSHKSQREFTALKIDY